MAAHHPDNDGGAATDPRERGIGELVKDLASQTSTLVRQEIQLAQAEVTQKGKVAGKGAVPCRIIREQPLRDLVESIGKRFITKSLKTKDRKQAIRELRRKADEAVLLRY
jgi:hypothetical protein